MAKNDIIEYTSYEIPLNLYGWYNSNKKKLFGRDYDLHEKCFIHKAIVYSPDEVYIIATLSEKRELIVKRAFYFTFENEYTMC